MLLPLLILASLGYVAFAVTTTIKENRLRTASSSEVLHPSAKFIFAGGIPIVVCITMTYLFLIVRGATTVQFNVGSSSRMDARSTWVELWPLFLLLTAASGLGSLIWLMICTLIKSIRPLAPAAIASLLFSTLAHLTVWNYYPTA